MINKDFFLALDLLEKEGKIDKELRLRQLLPLRTKESQAKHVPLAFRSTNNAIRSGSSLTRKLSRPSRILKKRYLSKTLRRSNLLTK